MRILKVLYLFLFLSSFSTTQKHVIYVYIEDYKRVLEFTNSKSEFLHEKRKVVLSIESPKLISCQVFLDNVLIGQGNFEVTDDKYELNIMVPIGGYDDALKDSTIFYPIYKKSGNWIWPKSGTNLYYYQGIKLLKNQKVVHLGNLEKDILLTAGNGELKYHNSHYVFRSNENLDTIQYWKIEGFKNSKTGFYIKTSNVISKSEKATTVINGYKIQVIDSVFAIPIYREK